MSRRVAIVLLGGGLVLAGAYVAVTVLSPRPGAPAPEPGRAAAPSAARPSPAAPEPEAPAAPRPVAAEPAPSPPPPPPPAAPELGTLRIDSDVAGADVFIDRVFIGKSPVVAHDVRPGTHRLNLSAPGYEGVVETIDVAPGSRDLLIKIREVRLEAEVEVVHRHRLGSCRGALAATPQRLEYRTDNANDRFAVPLGDLVAFDVDYLNKRLTIELREGRRYEFTDPEGNADRLFVFHRDVEKARERLDRGDPPANP